MSWFFTFIESDDQVISKLLYQGQQDGNWTTIEEEMEVIPGVVYRLELEVLQGGLESPDAIVLKITLNENEFGECNPPGSDYSCSFYKCHFELDQNEIFSLTGLLHVYLKYKHASHHCDCDETTSECSPKKREDKSGDVPNRGQVHAVARITLTPIRNTKGRNTTYSILFLNLHVNINTKIILQ